MTATVAGQMTLDLWSTENETLDSPMRDPLDAFLTWAHGRGCPPGIDPIAREVFERMPEPYDRCKALVTVTAHDRLDEEAVGALGLLDTSLDYHVCWDRAWFLRCGGDPSLAGRVMSCAYGATPSFYDVDGNLLATLVAAYVTTDELARLDRMREYGRRKVSEKKTAAEKARTEGKTTGRD